MTEEYKTLVYSTVGELDLKFDLWTPAQAHETSKALPLVIWYHGGGLVIGNRNDGLFAKWLKDACVARGYYFMSPDHRLLVPSTAHHLVEDVRALFTFLKSPKMKENLPHESAIDLSRIAVSGSSAGGYLARLAALYGEPRPVAMLSLFGMGGDFLTDHVLAGHEIFRWIYEDRIQKSEVDHLLNNKSVLAEAPIKFGPRGLAEDSGRAKIFIYGHQEGEFLDYFYGEPGISKRLRSKPYAERAALIPEEHKSVTTQLHAHKFPPTILIHGLADAIVIPAESEVTAEALRKAGTPCELVLIPEALHGLMGSDRKPVKECPEVFAKAVQFLAKYLDGSS